MRRPYAGGSGSGEAVTSRGGRRGRTHRAGRRCRAPSRPLRPPALVIGAPLPVGLGRFGEVLRLCVVGRPPPPDQVQGRLSPSPALRPFDPSTRSGHRKLRDFPSPQFVEPVETSNRTPRGSPAPTLPPAFRQAQGPSPPPPQFVGLVETHPEVPSASAPHPVVLRPCGSSCISFPKGTGTWTSNRRARSLSSLRRAGVGAGNRRSRDGRTGRISRSGAGAGGGRWPPATAWRSRSGRWPRPGSPG